MKDKMPVRVRLDPDYSGFEQQVIGWADSDGPDMADWPVYVRADLAPSPTPDVRVTEEMVERAALAIFKAWYGDEEGWASTWHLARPTHMAQARAALTAFLASIGDKP